MKTTTILGLGLIGFVLLALLTIVLAGGWIESDLAERGRNELDAAGHGWAELSVSGRDVTLSGAVPEGVSSQGAVEAVAGVWGVRVVRDETTGP